MKFLYWLLGLNQFGEPLHPVTKCPEGPDCYYCNDTIKNGTEYF